MILISKGGADDSIGMAEAASDGVLPGVEEYFLYIFVKTGPACTARNYVNCLIPAVAAAKMAGWTYLHHDPVIPVSREGGPPPSADECYNLVDTYWGKREGALLAARNVSRAVRIKDGVEQIMVTDQYWPRLEGPSVVGRDQKTMRRRQVLIGSHYGCSD